ncbi:MAG: mandelate racemase/muconate lactonizing enzyme family protein [Candidatus Thermoplasmatota archaeon]|jgi:L-alanine-DL-glutamate epimerase-like enolase superfamily enzyme|uniref:mandelate racemase/muconate lactonizing enzyme family protein n=1 Tax=Ferroplasma sp. TaxID=2591003 RepID=UPI002632B2A9|nr:mandelate racemase/muconate lactonizing enzyme family protein [Ferroplasma sp.]MCL4312122.1 mandelate racemase/muconate lactonizing enzyme family protein [Candidatus Thermoplasmatota archaeon]
METIKDIEIYELGSSEEKSSPWSSTILILKLTSSEGRVGFGEAPTTMMTLPVKESMNEVARIFQNKNYFNIEKNLRDYYKNAFYVTKSVEETAALSAFEIASWDLIGKNLGSPVYNLLGGKFNDEIRAYANGWYSDCVSPEDFVSKAKSLVSIGYSAFKFDPFGNNYDKINEEGIKKSAEIVAQMRSSLGDKIDLLIECHGRFSPKYAISAGKALEEYNPLFIEEPVHPELENSLREFRSKVNIPVALGERLLNKEDFARYVSGGMVDVIQPDLTNSKGILEAKKIAAIAESFGVPVAYHNAFGPVQTAATVNVDYTLPNFLIQESFEESWPAWKKNLFSGYSVKNGSIQLSGKPGLGIEVNEKLLEDSKVSGMEPLGTEPPWVVSGTFKP